MKNGIKCHLWTLAILVLSAAAGAALAGAQLTTSQWVYFGPDGSLAYKTTAAGDRIMDFSYAGYGGGGVALPDAMVVKTVQPSGAADDTDAIESAIAEVAQLPMKDGLRGAVLLAPGVFKCSRTIVIGNDGVVLRGSGSAADDSKRTTLQLDGPPHLGISVGSNARGRRGESGDTESSAAETGSPVSGLRETSFSDAYVPSGTRSFHVADAAGFSVGDWIEIRRPVTQAWVKFMHMDDLVRDGKPQTWIRVGNNTITQRRISAIDGNQFTVDVPLTDSFDAKYLNPPGTKVVRIDPPKLVSNVGIENLHIESPLQAFNHTQPHFQAIRINGQDCWAQHVMIDETMNSVGVSGRRITLRYVTVTRKALHQGASKPAEFAPNASQVLLDHCDVNADNVWFVATGAGQAGPMVLLNCTFHGNGAAESHQRWSTGLLYDNCSAPEGEIEIRNRGSMGSGHGWSLGWGVIWNCTAKNFIVQNPPGALNWIIGSTGKELAAPRPFDKGPELAGGTVDSADAPVAPRSLYLEQLRERLGAGALKNIGYGD